MIRASRWPASRSRRSQECIGSRGISDPAIRRAVAVVGAAVAAVVAEAAARERRVLVAVVPARQPVVAPPEQVALERVPARRVVEQARPARQLTRQRSRLPWPQAAADAAAAIPRWSTP